MNVSRWIGPAVTVVALGGVGAAAFLTRDRWVPYAFPEKAAKPAGGHAHDEGGGHEGHDHGPAGDRVKLSAQAQKNLKLDVDVIAPEPYWRKLLIPGVVADRPGESDRGVAARFAGVVEKVHAKPGVAVAAGQPLFTMRVVSDVVLGWQRDLGAAGKELAIATADRDRTAKQVAEKVVAPVTLVEPENKLKRAVAQVDGLRRQLQAFGLTATEIKQIQDGIPVTEMVVYAPPADDDEPAPTTGKKAATVYEVQKLKVTLGEAVQAGQSLALLARHQKLFVEGQAFKSEALALAKLAEARTPVPAEFADEKPGDWPEQPPLVIEHLANEVDPATLTFAFYLPLDNVPRTFDRDGKTHFVWRYRPGQRVRLRVPVEKVGDAVLVLPAGAVVREGGEAFAFVQNGDLFVRKTVRVLYEDRTDVVLANDGSLPGGAFVVRNQAAALNRAVKAAAGGGGGGHEGHDH